jgi:hypothetical protein
MPYLMIMGLVFSHWVELGRLRHDWVKYNEDMLIFRKFDVSNTVHGRER